MNPEKRREICECHFGDDDIRIEGWRLNNVHVIPEYLEEDQEVDFYLDTGEDIYLLRLTKNRKNSITFCEGDVVFIIVERLFTSDILTELSNIILLLKEKDIPENLKGQISVHIENE